MPIFTPEKELSHLPQTPVILGMILRSVDAQQARQATDGADGWSVVEIVGHLNDYDEIFMHRTRQMLEQDGAALQSYNPVELVKAGGYARSDIGEVYASFVSRRRAYINLLRSLTTEQWYHTGNHPTWNEITLLEHATNGALHDVNHIEQIIKALDSSLGSSPL